MKKNLLLIFLILSLLVSCATKSVVSGDPTAVDAYPAAEAEMEPTAAVEQPQIEEPAVVEEETTEVSEPISMEVDPFADFVVSESVEASETVEDPEAQWTMETDETSGPEFDWSAFIPAAPAEDLSLWNTPFAENPEAVVEETPSQVEEPQIVVEEVPEKPVEPVSEPALEQPSVTEEPKVEKEPVSEVETALPAAVVEEAPASASYRDYIEKVGKFIVKEKLFSVGILSCIIGAIYLIVALIKTSEARLEKDDYYGAKADRKDEDVTFEDEPKNDSNKPEDKADTELSDEDDEFLRTLLGENG